MGEWTVVLSGVSTVVGVAGVVTSSTTALRASALKRHIERAEGAASMLAALRSLPRPDGGRLFVRGRESPLQDELARIVRESAAAYVKQNPTPAGGDFVRTVMPVYSVLFLAVGISAFINAARPDGDLGDRLAGGLFGSLGAIALGITVILYSRMVKRNKARRLAGTPGEETYFGPVVEIYRFAVNAWLKRRVRRGKRRRSTQMVGRLEMDARAAMSDE